MTNPIYTTEARILNAEGFNSALSRVTPAPSTAYAFIGKNDAWPLDSNGDEIIPTPLDQLNGHEQETRDSLLALKRITASDVAHVIPRYNWTENTVYSQYSNDDALLFTKNFYVVTSDFNVYKCLDNNSGGLSTIEPSGSSTSTFVTADGYTWKFMYDIPVGLATKFVSESWIPVSTGSTKSSLQEATETAATYSIGDPIGGHGSSAFQELGAFRLMAAISFTGTESNTFPVNDDFRQVGVLFDPELSGGGAGTASVYAASSIDTNSGRLMYIENRASITRSATQEEDIKIVIEF